MSRNSEQETPPPEIVIVRRKRGGDECHHGGVWKVAFADFMTAMMAFFLVMWLINAANEETRSQVASYFNPVKLVDSTTNPRGLQENRQSSSGNVENRELKSEALAKTDEGEGSASEEMQKKERQKPGPAAHLSGGDVPENELFRDPLRTLERIAGGAPDLLKGVAQPRQQTTGAAGGEEFRDPFSPRSWESLEEVLPEELLDAPEEQGASGEKPGAAQQRDATRRLAAASATAQAARQNAGQQAARGKGRQQEQQQRLQQADAEVRALRKAIAQELRKAGDPASLPEVAVKRTQEGILISLADREGFGMFGIGSARPKAQTVRFMARIARLLKQRKGAIVVRGHTDGRPFRNRHYDNWRLSTARAHMARYMLLRGGVPESRIIRVEGHADRSLAVPDDPLAAKNRRIEILLKDEA